MKCINHNIFITYDPDERFRKVLPNGKSLIIPYKWDYVDAYGQKNGKMVENINGLETDPQVGYVLHENPDYPFKEGDKLVFHYLAINYACEVNGQKGGFIDARSVFFTDNGRIKMCEGIYLGEQMVDEIPQTPSGIYMGHLERKKECHIRLTHVYEGSEFKIGDIVFTVDGRQYPIRYQDKNYIKLSDDIIVGKVENITK